MIIIALVKSEQTGGRRCSFEVRPIRPLGLNALLMTARLPARLSERRLSRALDRCRARLLSNSVRLILPHRDFKYAERLISMGFSRPDCRELLRSTSGPILSAAASRHDRALLSSPRADNDTLRAFRALAADFRRVTLDMPAQEAERLADRAWSLGLTPEPIPRSRAVEADAAAFMSRPCAPVFLPSRCVYLSPDGPGAGILGGREVERIRFALPERLRDTLPGGFDAPALLSEALFSGVLSPEDVRIM